MVDLSLPYRPCAGIAVFNRQGKVFVGERIDTPGAWQMPQGGIDPDEDLLSAVKRELYEETGIRSVELLEIMPEKLRYDFPEGFTNKYLIERFRGQEQSWTALRFTGEDSEINLEAHDPPEFRAWQWVELSRITDLIVPFKRDLYEQVAAGFARHTRPS